MSTNKVTVTTIEQAKAIADAESASWKEAKAALQFLLAEIARLKESGIR